MNPERPSFNPENPDLPGYNPEKSVEAPPKQGVSPDSKEKKELPPDVAESHRQLGEMIAELKSHTNFERSRTENGREIITSPEGEKFTIREIKDPFDPVVKPMHTLLRREFGKDEVEPLSWVRHAIKEGLYAYHVIEDERGEVVSMAVTQPLELEPDKTKGGDQPKEIMLAEWFIHTNPASANSRMMSKQLFASAGEYCLNKAQEEGAKFKGFVGELVTDVEKFMNRFGHKRLYFEDVQGNIKEVPYYYGPSEFDTQTGAPGSEIGQEHLMVRLLDESPGMPVEEVLRIVTSAYREYVATPDDYDNPKAYETAKAFTDNMLAELRAALGEAKDGQVFFLSERERRAKTAELEAQGKKVEDMVTEDDKERLEAEEKEKKAK